MISSRAFLLLAALLALSSGSAPAAETTHVVIQGDTIFSLSRLHGISQEELMSRNGITNPSLLRVGTRLSIPPAPPRPAAPAPVRLERMVSPGETLFSIARVNGVTLQALRDINGFSASRVLRAGETIRIPYPAIAVPAAAQPAAGPQHPAQPAARRGDPSLRWPVQAAEVSYMAGTSGGVLILGRESESVRSMSRGTVVYAGPWRGHGNVVIVDSAEGFWFLYGANESLSVRVGDLVEPGTELGKLGIYPASGRPELVFVVMRNGVPVDPATAPRP